MPQFSPMSWISVFVFLIGMMVNMFIINWWYNESDVYSVGQVGFKTKDGCSRLFIWGKAL
uniref:ATP synthase F0 subunit 8 n=1 Tax=Unio tumidus TaxID=143298 RepID=A0A1Q1MMR6_9BIVA|nr:ATP synthase F0 subunit 8 [Unio tumidus]AQM37807.1 ATP synthase F0 subunit 8 [Unio tumidus]AQM37821.1 ATP synthase F0 subunit 8 [Unio tumidus]